jgi:hypothetical protein
MDQGARSPHVTGTGRSRGAALTSAKAAATAAAVFTQVLGLAATAATVVAAAAPVQAVSKLWHLQLLQEWQ